jgi:hypothetical protein
VVWSGIGLRVDGDPTPDVDPTPNPTHPESGIGKPNPATDSVSDVGLDPENRLSTRNTTRNSATLAVDPTQPYAPTLDKSVAERLGEIE